MELTLVLGVYATQLLAGTLLVLLLYRRAPLTWPGALARALLLGPLGLAAQMQAYHFAGIPFTLASVLVPWFVAAVPALAWGRSRFERKATRGFERGLLMLAGALFLLAAVRGMRVPLFSSDAVRNFAMHGKVFAEHRNLAPDALHAIRVGGHREYPPLVALNEALLFQASADTRCAKPFFALAYLAYLLLVIEAVRRRRPAFTAGALGVAFLCLPQAAYAASGGMADLRLVAAFLLLALEARALVAWPSRSAALRVAVCAGLCASTKNEGLAVSLVALVLLAVWGLRGRTLSLATLASSIAVWALLVAPWQLFKRAHGISERYLAHAVDQSPLENVGRVGPIARKFAEVGFFPVQVGHATFAFHWGLALFAIALAFAARDRDRRRRVLPWAVCLIAHVGLYAAVFLVTPREFDWHIASASERLLFHTTPWLLLVSAAALTQRSGVPPAAGPTRL